MRSEDESEWSSEDSGLGSPPASPSSDLDDEEGPPSASDGLPLDGPPLDALLRRRLRYSPAQPHYAALQRALLLLPVDAERADAWALLAKAVTELMLQLSGAQPLQGIDLPTLLQRSALLLLPVDAERADAWALLAKAVTELMLQLSGAQPLQGIDLPTLLQRSALLLLPVDAERADAWALLAKAVTELMLQLSGAQPLQGIDLPTLLQRSALLLLPVDAERADAWALLAKAVTELMLQLSGAQPLQGIDLPTLLQRLRQEADFEELEKEAKRSAEELAQATKDLHEANKTIRSLKAASKGDAGSSDRGKGEAVHVEVPDGEAMFPTPPDSPPTTSPAPPAAAPAPPPPPPPPPANLPPPPPPLPLGGLKAKAPSVQRRAWVPKPSVALKTVNWSRLSPDKAGDGTVWASVKDREVYKVLDMADIEARFATGLAKSSGSGEGEECEKASLWSGASSTDTWKRGSRDAQLSVMDRRRAQNCTILLSRLKLTGPDIRLALLDMDAKDRIPKDMTENLLKYMPTEEEVAALESLLDTASPALLAPADRLLWELSRIPRSQHRLRCLHYRKAFADHLGDLRPQVAAVASASTAVKGSEKLAELLGVILAMGNFLNHGKANSDAPGFSLAALNRLVEVKAVGAGGVSDYSLLHCLVETVERHFPHLLRLKRDLGSVFDAARISGAEVDGELRRLAKGLDDIHREVQLHRGQSPDSSLDDSAETPVPAKPVPGDRFVEVMESFVSEARVALDALRASVEEMKASFAACVAHFGMEAGKTSTEDFFGLLGKFVSSFAEVERAGKARREEEERRAKTLAWSATLGSQSRRSGQGLVRASQAQAAGDFDQLVAALQDGQVYQQNLSRLRASFRGPKRRERDKANRKSTDSLAHLPNQATRDR